MNSSVRRVAVFGGIRIPFARRNGPYAQASNRDMLTATLDALVDRFELRGTVLAEVAAGAVLKHSRDFNLTRESVLGSRLAPETPAYDSSRRAGPGSRPRSFIANKIALGQIELAAESHPSSRPHTTTDFSTTSCCRAWGSSATRTSGRTPAPRSSPSSSRCSAAPRAR
jgi:hypothetical protein